MLSKILVALDHGETAIALFEQAIALAQAFGAELMLLSVLTPGETDGPMMPSTAGLPYYSLAASERIWAVYQENLRECQAKELERLQAFCQQAQAAGVAAEFTQGIGNPGKVICDLAKTWEANLIVVGNRGRQGISEMLLGSVSNYVMHHAPCSVLVAKISQTAEKTDEPADLAAVEG